MPEAFCAWCGFEGTQEEVDEHLIYMIIVVEDKDHIYGADR